MVGSNNKMVGTLEISELLMSKLCHDLAGPIGAVNNGVELLKDPRPDLHAESIELVETSASEAVARLLYFRHAYGPVRNSAGTAMATIKDLVHNFYKNKQITFIWPEMHGDADSMNLIKNDMAKLMLNIILIVAGGLIHGGNITIKIKNQRNNFGIKVRGEGRAVKLHEYLSAPLANNFKESEMDSRNVQACLTNMLAQRIGGKIKMETGDNFLEIVAS